MNKQLFIAFFACFFALNVVGQSCLPNGITFNNQAQINNFTANYPGCTNIQGNVTIDPQGGNITNLNGLNGLLYIAGDLSITNSTALVNLNGLNNLQLIGGSLWLYGNSALNSLDGLNNLSSVGAELRIGLYEQLSNPALTSLDGLSSLTTVGQMLSVGHTPLLQNLTGLESLNSAARIHIHDNQNLTALTGLEGLGSLQDIFLLRNPKLNDLSALSNITKLEGSQGLSIRENTALTNLDGLENLTIVEGYLDIIGNAALSNLNGIQNITQAKRGIQISGSPAIANLSALGNMVTVGGSIVISDMDGLTDLQGLENTSFSYGRSLYIDGNASLASLNGLGNHSNLWSLFLGQNPLLTSLNGLQNLSAVDGQLVINGNAGLQTLSGLSNLTSVGTLVLENNHSLINLNGLSNLNTLENLSIVNSSQLQNLTGLEGASVSGNVYLEQNALLENLNGLQGSTTLNQLVISSNPALTNLGGLENLRKIFGGLRINNNALLANLNALSSLSTLRQDLFVFGNQSLSDCAVFGICQFVADPPQPDSVGIGNNAPGCNSPNEVSSLCTRNTVIVEVLVEDISGSIPVADFPVRLEGGLQTSLKPTTANGIAKFLYFDTAYFQVTLPNLSAQNWSLNEFRQYLVDINGSDSTHVKLFLSPVVQCPELNVKLHLPTNFRGCLVNSDLRVSTQNSGTVLAEAGKLALVMPPVFELLNTEPLMSGQNGDTLYFELGDLMPLETGQVKLTVKTKCDTFLMGQTLCWEAFAAMDNPCPPTGQAFSEIKLSAKCVGDTIVRLGLKNIGDAPTQGWHEYRIIRNELVQFNNAFNLGPQESLSFDFPANGATWRMEATKFADGTQTAVALENCGGLTPGLITAFWLDHGPVEYDFDCRQVVQAYDPNQKTAIPTGAGHNHIISTRQPIFYTIDFQNTGTDTAYRVLLLDELSDNLELSSFKAEGSSHPCSWELRGNKLEVLFMPIALPDSNVNEAASHGHFRFSILPKSSLVGGSTIHNFAKIIFDYNWPIWTNVVQHTIGQLTVSVDEAQPQTHLWQVLGNPTRERAIFRTQSYVAGEKHFELMDLGGRVLRSARFSEQTFEFRRDMLPTGLFIFRISDEQNRVFTGKIVVAD